MLPRRSACPLRKARLDRRDLPDRRGLLDRRVLLDRRGLWVLRESQVPLGLRPPLVHRDRPDFGAPRRVVIRPVCQVSCNENEYLLNAYVLDARGSLVHHDDRRLSFTPARHGGFFTRARRGAGKVVVICAMR